MKPNAEPDFIDLVAFLFYSRKTILLFFVLSLTVGTIVQVYILSTSPVAKTFAFKVHADSEEIDLDQTAEKDQFQNLFVNSENSMNFAKNLVAGSDEALAPNEIEDISNSLKIEALIAGQYSLTFSVPKKLKAVLNESHVYKTLTMSVNRLNKSIEVLSIPIDTIMQKIQNVQAKSGEIKYSVLELAKQHDKSILEKLKVFDVPNGDGRTLFDSQMLYILLASIRDSDLEKKEIVQKIHALEAQYADLVLKKSALNKQMEKRNRTLLPEVHEVREFARNASTSNPMMNSRAILALISFGALGLVFGVLVSLLRQFIFKNSERFRKIAKSGYFPSLSPTAESLAKNQNEATSF